MFEINVCLNDIFQTYGVLYIVRKIFCISTVVEGGRYLSQHCTLAQKEEHMHGLKYYCTRVIQLTTHSSQLFICQLFKVDGTKDMQLRTEGVKHLIL